MSRWNGRCDSPHCHDVAIEHGAQYSFCRIHDPAVQGGACPRCGALPATEHTDACMLAQEADLWRFVAMAQDECLTQIREQAIIAQTAIVRPAAARPRDLAHRQDIGQLGDATRAVAAILRLIGESETARAARMQGRRA